MSKPQLRVLPSALFLLSLFLLVIAGRAIAEERFEPPPDDYDWIQLTSDEWLKGELISLYDDQLIFDSDILGVLKIDWEDVKVFRGHGEHRISLTGLQTGTGVLRIDNQQVVLESEDGRLESARDDDEGGSARSAEGRAMAELFPR